MTKPSPPPSLTLLVIYTQRLDQCRDFYSDLGLSFVAERHGSGPQHYAAELVGGTVLELYPGTPERTTGRLRLGLAVDARPEHEPGISQVSDPDGRIVELHTRTPVTGGLSAADAASDGDGPSS